MAHVTYDIVEHDGGYAYKVGDVFSETYPSHAAAHLAAELAAQRQQSEGRDDMIEFQDENGAWHVEQARAGDRPEVDVEDELEASSGSRH
jgi:hypothetical protein